MKRLHRIGILFALAACLGLTAVHAQSYASLWKQVEEAQRKSLPQTVIKLTGDIYRKAGLEKNAPQMLKAALCRNHQRGMLTPDSFYVDLAHRERWAQTEQNPVSKAILHSLLADDYAGYMQQNRRALQQRTPMEDEETPADVRQWSITQFIAKVDEHSRAALSDSLSLLQTSAASYVPFVVTGEESRYYGHDLYHLLANRAVAAYRQLAGFDADSLMNCRIDATYRHLIDAYRRRAGSEDAVLLSQLDYWSWKLAGDAPHAPRPAFGEGGDEATRSYTGVLDELIRQYGNRELCAEVYIKKASWLQAGGEGRSVAEALQVCNEGLKRYPSYRRIGELKNLRAAILQPQLHLSTGSGCYPGDSIKLYVNHRQLPGFTLRLYATKLGEVPRTEPYKSVNTYKKGARLLSATHFALRPSAEAGKLPQDVPYLLSDTVFSLPMPQETGVYILSLEPDVAAKGAKDQFLVSTRFKVLTLNLGDGRAEAVTLDARTGQPIAGATVGFYSSYSNQKPELLAEVVTDAQGKAVLPWRQDIRSYVARKAEDTAMMPQAIYMRSSDASLEEPPVKQLTLLTDRALYRPGQTVYVKGVAYVQYSDSARVLAGADFELALLDVNRKQLSTLKVRTNDFGSFTAQFVLPAACLNGMFILQSQDPDASAAFRVEEYKRPSFEITFSPVSEAYRLGDRVKLRGNVKSFNGMTVQEVPLAYTVRRQNIFRSYWERRNPPLLADTLRLDANGNFSLELALDAPAEEAANGRFGGIYTYTVEAVVTDGGGETQTASCHLQAGSRAFVTDVQVPQSVCKEDSLFFTFGVTNGMGVPQSVKGTYRLYTVDDNREFPKTGRGQASGQPVFEGAFTANRPEDCTAWGKLPSGMYSLKLVVRDSLGREEITEAFGEDHRFLLFSRSDKRPATFTHLFYTKESETFDARHPASFYLGTSHREVYLLMDVFCNRKRVESRAMQLSDTIVRLEIPYQEKYGEGATLLFSFVKGGEVHTKEVYLEKRKPQRELRMKWEVFRDRLRPGQQEEWKLVIKTPEGVPAAAEVLAMMYDASLDKIYSRNQLLQVYYPNGRFGISRGTSHHNTFYFSIRFPMNSWRVPGWLFDRFYVPYLDDRGQTYVELKETAVVVTGYGRPRTKAMAAMNASAKDELGEVVFEEELVSVDEESSPARGGETLPPAAGLRTNFAETAFFYPQLRTNEQGEVAFSFTMPQSLTRWNFRSYSHTRSMLTGRLDATAVTAKEFMLTPNLPRFVRVGDATQVAAGIANLTGQAVKGTATLTLFNPETEKVIATRKQKFEVAAGKKETVTFHFEATDGLGVLGVRIVADGGTFSDGEQHLLPVLSNKEYITETLAMPVRGGETRKFALDSLFNGNSRTATQRRLTVEFTGNPAWYAVQALPSLSLPSTDNAVAWATAFYANNLAGYIARSQPRIKAVFDGWKLKGGTKETFLSQLEKNQEVKNILLSESPWVMEAASEAERQARIATLFDVNQLSNGNLAAFTKLKELQNKDGAWGWYKGMDGSLHITTYIAELLVRLPLMTGEALAADAGELLQNAFDYLHKEALREYRTLRQAEKEGAKVTTLPDATLKYLYLIALSGREVPSQNEAAHRYFLSKVGGELRAGTMRRKAQSVLILQKANRRAEAAEFIASIKEHLVQAEELGAYFAFDAHPYHWGMLPVPTHVEVMNALLGSGGNEALVEEMKLWLLKQKQTTAWNSPVATADAVYALLCRGSNLLENRGDVRITLGGETLETLLPGETRVPGLGYIRHTWEQGNPVLKAKSVTVEKRDAGIAWGAVYAQYLSPISEVKQHGGALDIEKKLYVERIASDGRKSLQPIDPATPLAAGDKVIARLTIRLDRAMDFVQLKDQRGACFEPIGALSGYCWSNGFGYYTEVEDAATNFFFDHLGKGVYVLEHSYRIARGGTYETGLATLQCAYAPEYASHSTGGRVVIK